MEKLKQGDYVTNLTEEQFDELIGTSDSVLSWGANKMDSKNFISKSVVFRHITLFHTRESWATTELPFDVFKQRAINTFKK